MGKRVFISFAIEDKFLRDALIGQRNNEHSDIDFTDMSVKDPWDSAWKTQCRARIKGCEGVIGIVTKNTKTADGQLWELKCAYEENVPVLLIHGSQANRPAVLPEPIKGRMIYDWTWERISNFVKGL